MHTINGTKVSQLVHHGNNLNETDNLCTFPVAQWRADINYQLNTTYPEPGILTQHNDRSDCLFEQPPSYKYLELWKFEKDSIGRCICLDLMKETCIDNECNIQRTSGRMLIMGNHLMIARDRKQCTKQMIERFDDEHLCLQSVINNQQNLDFAKAILDSEYSYAIIKEQCDDCMECEIQLSSIPFYVGRSITLFDETNWKVTDDNTLIQIDESVQVKRYWQMKHIGTYENDIFGQ